MFTKFKWNEDGDDENKGYYLTAFSDELEEWIRIADVYSIPNTTKWIIQNLMTRKNNGVNYNEMWEKHIEKDLATAIKTAEKFANIFVYYFNEKEEVINKLLKSFDESDK